MNPVSGDWVQEHVEWLYGFKLLPFQLEDLMKLLNGGVYSVLYPTDHGKSMLIEIETVLTLIRDPNSRHVIIKVNDQAAREISEELARRLHKAATRYPAVEPMCAWRGDLPHNVGKGFWVKGADFLGGRNTNRSVRCYGLGSKDLQGKRGRTKIDDIVTEQEARSQAHRDTVDARLDQVLRTLEADELDGLWAMFGTPQYEGSPYERIPMALQDKGIACQVIRRPIRDERGVPLMESRVHKSEVHAATMSKSTYAATYELKPYGQKRPTSAQIDTLIKHRGMPIPRNELDFKRWLMGELERRYMGEVDAQKKAIALMAELEFYVGWDPAEQGDSAQSAIAKLQRHVWVLRAVLSGGIGVFEQSVIIGRLVDLFPSAQVVMENNATQKAFRDVHEFRRPDDVVLEHGTYRNKNHGPISIPSMVESMIEGYFHVPWQDELEAESTFSDLIDEIRKYSTASHPHIIPSIWFSWYFSERAAGRDLEEELPPGNAPTEITIQPERMPVLMPVTIAALAATQDERQERAREAWATVHESFR